MRIYNDLLQEQALIEWRWVESVPPKAAEQEKAPREYVGSDSPLRKKIKDITIDSISFEQYTVREAIEELKKKSQQHDPDGTGVNFAAKTPNPVQVFSIKKFLSPLKRFRFMMLSATCALFPVWASALMIKIR